MESFRTDFRTQYPLSSDEESPACSPTLRPVQNRHEDDCMEIDTAAGSEATPAVLSPQGSFIPPPSTPMNTPLTTSFPNRGLGQPPPPPTLPIRLSRIMNSSDPRLQGRTRHPTMGTTIQAPTSTLPPRPPVSVVSFNQADLSLDRLTRLAARDSTIRSSNTTSGAPLPSRVFSSRPSVPLPTFSGNIPASFGTGSTTFQAPGAHHGQTTGSQSFSDRLLPSPSRGILVAPTGPRGHDATRSSSKSVSFQNGPTAPRGLGACSTPSRAFSFQNVPTGPRLLSAGAVPPQFSSSQNVPTGPRHLGTTSFPPQSSSFQNGPSNSNVARSAELVRSLNTISTTAPAQETSFTPHTLFLTILTRRNNKTYFSITIPPPPFVRLSPLASHPQMETRPCFFITSRIHILKCGHLVAVPRNAEYCAPNCAGMAGPHLTPAEMNAFSDLWMKMNNYMHDAEIVASSHFNRRGGMPMTYGIEINKWQKHNPDMRHGNFACRKCGVEQGRTTTPAFIFKPMFVIIPVRDAVDEAVVAELERGIVPRPFNPGGAVRGRQGPRGAARGRGGQWQQRAAPYSSSLRQVSRSFGARNVSRGGRGRGGRFGNSNERRIEMPQAEEMETETSPVMNEVEEREAAENQLEEEMENLILDWVEGA